MNWILTGLSLRCLWVCGNKSRKQLELQVLQRRSQRVRGVVFANFPKSGKGPHQDLSLGLLPSEVRSFIERDRQRCSPFLSPWGSWILGWAESSAAFTQEGVGALQLLLPRRIPLLQSPAASGALAAGSSSPDCCSGEGHCPTSPGLPNPATAGRPY